MKKIYTIIFLLAVLAGCKKNDNDTIIDDKAGLQKISEGFALGAATKVELWSKADLTTGYNKMFLALYDSISNQPLKKSDLQITPMMDMNMNGMSMSHAAPAMQVESNVTESVLFPCAAVFTMPGSDQSTWSLMVSLKKDGQKNLGTAKLPLKVKASSHEQVKTITTADGVKLMVSYSFPEKPKIGINNFEMTIHRREDKMNFPAESNYTIVMTPEMPSMGHGSPNNVNPVIFKNGLYKGKINFTMTGEWKINLELAEKGEKTTLFFDLTF